MNTYVESYHEDFENLDVSESFYGLINQFEQSCLIETNSIRTSAEFQSLQPNTLASILKFFVTRGTKSSNPTKNSPKKDNFIAFIIRAQLNLFKSIINGKNSTKKSIKTDPKDPIHNRSRLSLIEIYSSNESTIKEFLNSKRRIIASSRRTLSCQLTDFSDNSEEYSSICSMMNQRSFNSQFCKVFFSHPCFRQGHLSLISILYSPDDPESLCSKFLLKCCKNSTHNENCEEKWQKLKNFMENGFIESFDAPAMFMNF